MKPFVVLAVFLCAVACDDSDDEPAASADEETSAAAVDPDPDLDDEADGEGDESPDDPRPPAQRDDQPEPHEPLADVSGVLETLCDQRAPCVEMDRWEAGSVDGTSLTVFELALHERGDEGRQPDMHDCAPFEYWLVESRDGEMTDHTKLQRVCNDGYGARQMGEDHVEVDHNAFVYSRHGGSSWMWTTTTVVQLSPLALREEHSSGYWTLDVNRRAESWDWTRPAGGVTWTAPHCEERKEELDYGNDPEHGEYRFDYLMQIKVDDNFRNGGWKTTDLGDCSLRAHSRGNDVDADNEEEFGSGYVIHGEPTDPEEASFRAVMDSESTLYLEIRDSEWITGADRWIHDDHVELWTGPSTGYSAHCLEPAAPSQWGIALFDDEIYPAYGDPGPDALDVQRHLVGDDDDPEALRMKIEFPSPPEALTVVYSDTDDGKAQTRLIATSDLRHGDAASLGQTRAIPPGDARCTVVDDELVFQDLRQFTDATTLP